MNADLHAADLTPARLEPLSPEQIREDLASHQAWLYGGEPGGVRIDWDRADLTGADLGGADLLLALMRKARMRKADLSKANLRGADLRKADLSKADLRGAVLVEADLREADLMDADLREADLRRADLSGADLSDADLRGADLSRARGNGREVQSAKVGLYRIVWTADTVWVGCQEFGRAEFLALTEADLSDDEHLALYRSHYAELRAMIVKD